MLVRPPSGSRGGAGYLGAPDNLENPQIIIIRTFI
jgi:hypothetical protein